MFLNLLHWMRLSKGSNKAGGETMPSNMYRDAEMWSPFVGCLHVCVYCEASFRRQVKRWAKRNRELCYRYIPHSHFERLKHVPNSPVVFVCGDGDIAFCDTETIKLMRAA
jgi:hypothetical protein